MSKSPILGLTVYRPWSWAIAEGLKDVENRSWTPNIPIGHYLAIHAGLKWDRSALPFFDRIRRMPGCNLPGVTPRADQCDEGIIAIAKYGGYITPDQAPDNPWLIGPYGWKLDHVVKLNQPVPCKGAQRLWALPPDVLALVRAGYKSTMGGADGTQT